MDVPTDLNQDHSEALQHDLQIANRALRVLSACTQAVIRAVDEQTLLQNLVQLITEEAAYRMAWIGYVCHDAAKAVQPMVWAGHELGYIEEANITGTDAPRGQGATGEAIQSRKPFACQNMLEDPNFAHCREAARQRGYQSSLVLPLLNQEEVFGCLNIYSTEADAFNPQEVLLLQELSNSLSFGIISLRTKQEHRQAELALQRSEEKFSKAFYSSPISKTITTIDEGKYIEVNHSFERIFGYTRTDVLNRTSTEIGIWHNLDDRQQMFQQLNADGKLVKYEAIFRAKNGDILTCNVSAEFLQIADKLCILAAVEDITNRRRAELTILRLNIELENRVEERTAEIIQATERLQILNQELRHSNQELEQFAYVVSHDLQEPLRAVMGYTQLLISEYGDRFDDNAKSYAEYAIDGAKRMQLLIQDLLAYSRVGTRAKEFASTDCNAVVKEAIRNLHLAIAEKRAEITIEPLPLVNGDRIQLVQLWQNLIGNAIKFCKDDHPRLQIRVTQRKADFLFQLTDNGIGIKPQYLDCIFEVFKRLHTQREYAGTGIGLAICKKIVLRHGGVIWAESTPNVGTTFFFTIPLKLQSPE